MPEKSSLLTRLALPATPSPLLTARTPGGRGVQPVAKSLKEAEIKKGSAPLLAPASFRPSNPLPPDSAPRKGFHLGLAGPSEPEDRALRSHKASVAGLGMKASGE